MVKTIYFSPNLPIFYPSNLKRKLSEKNSYNQCQKYSPFFHWSCQWILFFFCLLFFSLLLWAWITWLTCWLPLFSFFVYYYYFLFWGMMQRIGSCVGAFGLVWYTSSNICFQFLNNITRIFKHLFTHTYF